MAFIDSTQQVIAERDAALARRKALQNQMGQGLGQLAKMDADAKILERQKLKEDIMLADKYGYVDPKHREAIRGLEGRGEKALSRYGETEGTIGQLEAENVGPQQTEEGFLAQRATDEEFKKQREENYEDFEQDLKNLDSDRQKAGFSGMLTNIAEQGKKRRQAEQEALIKKYETQSKVADSRIKGAELGVQKAELGLESTRLKNKFLPEKMQLERMKSLNDMQLGQLKVNIQEQKLILDKQKHEDNARLKELGYGLDERKVILDEKYKAADMGLKREAQTFNRVIKEKQFDLDKQYKTGNQDLAREKFGFEKGYKGDRLKLDQEAQMLKHNKDEKGYILDREKFNEQKRVNNAKIKKLAKEAKESGKPADKVKVMKQLKDSTDKISKEFRPFDRLYGSIDSFKRKFIKGTMNPQEKLQLIRLLVPLTEINPGVVRSDEVNMVNQQQSRMDILRGFVRGELDGSRLTNKVVGEMFDATDSLRPVVLNMKRDSLAREYEFAKEVLSEGEARQILGSKNLGFISNPESFGRYFGKTGTIPQSKRDSKPIFDIINEEYMGGKKSNGKKKKLVPLNTRRKIDKAVKDFGVSKTQAEYILRKRGEIK